MQTYCVIFLVIGFAFMAVADGANAKIDAIFPVHAIFRQYDDVVINKITERWYHILDVPVKNPPPAGKVVMEFRLFPDGHVSDLKVDSSTVEESRVASCKKAITDSAPFASWTKEIRQAYTNDSRIIHFTFTYQ